MATLIKPKKNPPGDITMPPVAREKKTRSRIAALKYLEKFECVGAGHKREPHGNHA